ncbi:coproporphyrinogen dehydrogenase HemZ [Tissierella sp.]|uniref:coproporphyrinogen dehydrogenase HemZ n=1 Tax=Tissierella sp. TaxID=41274 RepID=UPI002860777A|nr:coproporphyrinogen dehydrogenase HemZ [Tissierella sp.]MDR7856422.1 coproporphyrinogen dehydrogenase HemZ [Tissierella sp.]
MYVDNLLVNQSIEDVNSIEVFSRSIDKNIKIGIKKSLYNCLISISDSKIPWGILTGIRPVKIVHDLLDKNIATDEIIKVLTSEYKINVDKTNLIMDIAKQQRDYIYPIDGKKYSLYISIPFCPTRCLYCSFPAVSIKGYENYIKEYTSRLIYEIEEISKSMKEKKINTVYIGGGTPTAIPQIELEKIIESIHYEFGDKNINEITVEAGRPDTITKEYLKMLNKNGIKRISINPQTMNNDTLKLIGRQHRAEDIIKTYHLAKDIGFDVINMDLIIGLPNEDLSDIENTLKEIKKLDPENLTVHTLSVKRGSRFKDTIDKYTLQSYDILDSMLNKTVEYSIENGLYPYYLYRQKQILGNFENVGYCKPELECIYNIAMMEEKETIMAVGMGAVSKIYSPKDNKIERVPNFKDLKEYLERIDELIESKRLALDRIIL